MGVKGNREEPVKLSAIDEDILTLLIGWELYGLQILDKLNNHRPIRIGFGSLYPALNRLVKKGLVEWRWGDESEETGGARRKYYQVTGLGEYTLKQVQNYRQLLTLRPTQAQASLVRG
ncbi:MAG: helix-turn-helix transcriptional regulator [Symploca sp. SIO3C6]|nr:helix-turn-helix transcriptional regulator [Symploca sp. SIO3C6]NET03550.1 helix-turn-helix transcriptional regulator [Symploca sp. SIO2B6]NET50683.1 helix-turn-helix transcriptional regulator [Merismopedia sp. SIO2A8]